MYFKSVFQLKVVFVTVSKLNLKKVYPVTQNPSSQIQKLYAASHFPNIVSPHMGNGSAEESWHP